MSRHRGRKTIDEVNYANADITTVLDSLSMISGANIVVSPDVKGTIPLLKLRNVTVDQVLAAIASMTGCTCRLTNRTYYFEKAASGTVISNSMPEKNAVFSLQNVSAKDMVDALATAYPDLKVKGLEDSRVVISGPSDRLESAKAFMLNIDVPVIKAAPVNIVEAKYVVKAIVPWEAKQYTENLFREQGLTISFAPNSRWSGTTTLAPTTTPAVQDPELQKIGLLTDAMNSLAKAESPPSSLVGIGRNGQVLIPGNGPPQQSAVPAQTEGSSQMTVTVPSGKTPDTWQSDTLILRGPQEVVDAALATLAKIDIGPDKVQKVYTCRYILANEAKDKLMELFSAQGLKVSVAPSKRGDTPPVQSSDSVTVPDTKPATGDEAMNKVFDIVLSGPQDVVDRAVALLNQLDTESTQVSIQTEVVSVNSNVTDELGVDWGLENIPVGLNEQQSGDALKFGRIVRNPLSFNLKISALQQQQKAKVLNQPSTVVQNGRQAVIHIGDKILYETLAGYSNGSAIYSTNELDVGVTMQVLPQVSSDGVVTLELSTNISTLTGFTTGADGASLPQTNETQSSTVVQVHDGEALVIGGLKQNSTSVTTRSVPVLGKIPLIGPLFASKTSVPSNTDLIIVVTPHILHRSPGALPAVTPPAAVTPATK